MAGFASGAKKAALARKIATNMREWKAGKLRSSSGQKVTSQKQALAISYSQAERGKR